MTACTTAQGQTRMHSTPPSPVLLQLVIFSTLFLPVASSLWTQLPLGRGNDRCASHGRLLTPHVPMYVYSGRQERAAGTGHRTRESSYSGAGPRKTPLLLGRANEESERDSHTQCSGYADKAGHAHARTHTQKPLTKGAGKGSEDLGGQNENGKGPAGSLTCAG